MRIKRIVKFKEIGVRLVAFFFSIVQAYCAYLLHHDLVQFPMMQWIVSIFYIPLYALLLLVGVLLEALFGLHLLKGGVVFPYLSDILWMLGGALLIPLNIWLLRLLKRFAKGVS